MGDDDRPIGRLLRRREMLALFAAAGASLLRPGAAHAQPGPSCIARPEQTEGPYFVDTGLGRSDIRTDAASGRAEPGVPLRLEFRVSRPDRGACRPLPQARVELWQCNALGLYSGVRDPHGDTRGRSYLRGYQTTDADGIARFVTVYPGWYPGRAVHLHFSIAVGEGVRREAFTSQLYFDDALSDRVLAQAPYAGRSGARVRNDADFIYRRSGGSQLLLAVREDGGGLQAAFDIGLQLDRRAG